MVCWRRWTRGRAPDALRVTEAPAPDAKADGADGHVTQQLDHAAPKSGKPRSKSDRRSSAASTSQKSTFSDARVPAGHGADAVLHLRRADDDVARRELDVHRAAAVERLVGEPAPLEVAAEQHDAEQQGLSIMVVPADAVAALVQ